MHNQRKWLFFLDFGVFTVVRAHRRVTVCKNLTKGILKRFSFQKRELWPWTFKAPCLCRRPNTPVSEWSLLWRISSSLRLGKVLMSGSLGRSITWGRPRSGAPSGLVGCSLSPSPYPWPWLLFCTTTGCTAKVGDDVLCLLCIQVYILYCVYKSEDLSWYVLNIIKSCDLSL